MMGEYGITEIKVLYKTYDNFLPTEVSLDDVLQEWKDIKLHIVDSAGLKSGTWLTTR